MRNFIYTLFVSESKGVKELLENTLKYGKFRNVIRLLLFWKIVYMNIVDRKNNMIKFEKLQKNGMIFQCKDSKFYLPSINKKHRRIYGEYVQREIFIRDNYYEGDLLDSLLNEIIEQNWNIVDVGANIGNHSLCFARKANEVISIEPVKLNFEILKKNVEINNKNNITLYQVGLGSHSSKGSIANVNTNNMGSTELEYDDNGEIVIVSMDELLVGKKIDFIKIDVEGFEYEVLQGAKRILKDQHPVIFVEIFDERFEIVNSYLMSLGYRIKKQYDSNYLYQSVVNE